MQMSRHITGLDAAMRVKSRKPGAGHCELSLGVGLHSDLRDQRKREQMRQMAYCREYVVVLFRCHAFDAAADFRQSLLLRSLPRVRFASTGVDMNYLVVKQRGIWHVRRPSVRVRQSDGRARSARTPHPTRGAQLRSRLPCAAHIGDDRGSRANAAQMSRKISRIDPTGVAIITRSACSDRFGRRSPPTHRSRRVSIARLNASAMTVEPDDAINLAGRSYRARERAADQPNADQRQPHARATASAGGNASRNCAFSSGNPTVTRNHSGSS